MTMERLPLPYLYLGCTTKYIVFCIVFSIKIRILYVDGLTGTTDRRKSPRADEP